MCYKRYHVIFSTFSLKFKCKICVQKAIIHNFKKSSFGHVTSYGLSHFEQIVDKSLLLCLRDDPLIVFRRQNHVTFIFIKTMSHDLLVQVAYCCMFYARPPFVMSSHRRVSWRLLTNVLHWRNRVTIFLVVQMNEWRINVLGGCYSWTLARYYLFPHYYFSIICLRLSEHWWIFTETTRSQTQLFVCIHAFIRSFNNQLTCTSIVNQFTHRMRIRQ